MIKRTFAVVAALAAGCGTEETECSDISGSSCTWAGTPGVTGTNEDGLNHRDALLYYPSDVAFHPDGSAWIADWNNHRVRRVTLDGKINTVVGTDYEGDGSVGETDRLPVGAPSGAAGIEVALNHPSEIDFLPDGRMVFGAWHNNKVRIHDPVTNITKVLAGNSYGYAGDDGPAHDAVFNLVPSVACAPDGSVFVIDQRNFRVRKITNDATPMITTFAGTGVEGSTGDGGPATQAQLGFHAGNTPLPSGSLAIDANYLYIANSSSNNIRRISFSTNIIECVAGCTANGAAGFSGDGSSAKSAMFDFPHDIEFGPDGRLYVADQNNNVIRAIDLQNDVIETVVGTGERCGVGEVCIETEGAPALEVRLNNPYGFGFDAEGSMYIADTLNSRIVRIAR